MTTLRNGLTGSDVKLLQEALSKYGIKADGIFGSKTEAAVRKFQEDNKLTVDGLAGKKTCKALNILEKIEQIQSEYSKLNVENKCEDLKQYSSPHGSMIYGPNSNYSTYKSGGCGVTSFAIVLRALKLVPNDETSTVTIQRIGKYAWEHGYRIKDNGTTAGLFNTNGVKSTKVSTKSKIEEAIRNNKFVILLIKKGFKNGYSGNGHYIVAYGIKDGYVLLRDVGSSYASRQKAPLASITTGLKGAYVIEKL